MQRCYLLHVRNSKLETDSHLDSDFKDPELYTSLGSVLHIIYLALVEMSLPVIFQTAGFPSDTDSTEVAG